MDNPETQATLCRSHKRKTKEKNVIYSPPFTCGFPLEVFSVSYFRQIGGCLQGFVNTFRYWRQASGCLQGVCALSVKTRTHTRDYKRKCVDADINITVNPT